jgi:hypothetical protein
MVTDEYSPVDVVSQAGRARGSLPVFTPQSIGALSIYKAVGLVVALLSHVFSTL